MPNKYKIKFAIKFDKVFERNFHIGINFCVEDYSDAFSNGNKTNFAFKVLHSEIYLYLCLGKIDLTIGRILKEEIRNGI